MILTHETIKADIDVSAEKINIWVIESKHRLNSFIRELISQKDGDDGSFVLSDDNEILRIKDHIDVITDFFDIDHNSKKIQSRMIKDYIYFLMISFISSNFCSISSTSRNCVLARIRLCSG